MFVEVFYSLSVFFVISYLHGSKLKRSHDAGGNVLFCFCLVSQLLDQKSKHKFKFCDDYFCFHVSPVDFDQ